MNPGFIDPVDHSESSVNLKNQTRKYIITERKGRLMNLSNTVPALGLIILLMCAVGCISGAPSASKIIPSPSDLQSIPGSSSSTIEPADMALQLPDLPAGFTLQENRERTRSDVSQLALDQGWKKGYHVMFGRKNESTMQMEYLTQDIDVYPIENVNLALAEGNTEMVRRSEDAYLVNPLSNPKIGDSSQAYTVELLRKSKKIQCHRHILSVCQK